MKEYKEEEDDARRYADYYVRTQRSAPKVFPPFISGDALLRCVAFGDFVQSRAKHPELIPSIYCTVWQEALAAQGAPKSKGDDSDESGSQDGGLQSQLPNAAESGDSNSAETNRDADSNAAALADDGSGESSNTAQLVWIDPAAIAAELAHLNDTTGYSDRYDEGVRVWLTHAQQHAQKSLQRATRQAAQQLERLIDDFPNLAEAATIVAGATLLRAEKNMPVRFPRLLLQGEPGCGKTEFVRAVADAASLPLITINLAAMHGEFELPGAHRTWRGALPGRLFQGLLKSPVANPMFLFDEAERGNRIVQSSLLQWLEDRYFRDQYLELDFRVDQVNSVLITNSLATLDAAVQSRCRLFEVHSLSDNEKRDIIQRIYTRLIQAEEFTDFASALDASMIERLMSQSLREVRMMLESALYTAALHQRRTLTEADLQLPEQPVTGFGFLRG